MDFPKVSFSSHLSLSLTHLSASSLRHQLLWLLTHVIVDRSWRVVNTPGGDPRLQCSPLALLAVWLLGDIFLGIKARVCWPRGTVCGAVVRVKELVCITTLRFILWDYLYIYNFTLVFWVFLLLFRFPPHHYLSEYDINIITKDYFINISKLFTAGLSTFTPLG